MTIRLLDLPAGVRAVWLATPAGALAGLDNEPALLSARAPRRPSPVLCVPGYTGSKEDFLPVLAPLADLGRRVVAVDLRGQADSPAAADPAAYALERLAADVVCVADVLAERAGAAVHLLGHSLGGLVARAAVLAAPDRFRSLTLLCSGPGALPGPRAALVRRLSAAGDPPDLAATWELKQRLELEAGAVAPPPELDEFLRRRFLANCPTGLLRMGEQLIAAPDRTDELAALTRRTALPVHVVYGQYDDAWPPSEQAEMARRLGAAETALPGVGHSPAVESPAATTTVLADFWAGTEAGDGADPMTAPSGDLRAVVAR